MYVAVVLTTSTILSTSTKETIVDPTTFIIRRVVCMLDEVKFIDTA